MTPEGLKIGDTFDEKDFTRTIRHKVIGFDGQGRYISECLGVVGIPFGVVPFDSTDDELVDDGAVEIDLPEEQPVVEEPKEVKAKTAPKKKTASKKKTATKKK